MPDHATPENTGIGAYIRSQRELSRMSLRELARLSEVSNAYLSQVERGLHEPSIRVLRAVARAMSIPFEEMMRRAVPSEGEADQSRSRCTIDEAIRVDPHLSQAQKNALMAVYDSFLAGGGPLPPIPGPWRGRP